MEKWLSLESNNYIFNYLANSFAEENINAIIAVQEQCYAEICNELGLSLPYKIKYYLCDTPETVGRINGDNEPCNGFADEPNLVYAVYNEDIQCIGHHEDAHVISYFINIPNSAALREGFAMRYDKEWWGISNRICTYLYYESNTYESICNLINDDIFYKLPCNISYPIVGAFTKFLIDSFGINKYLEIYKCKSNKILEQFDVTYNRSLRFLENEFLSYINDSTISEELKIEYKRILDIN